MRALRIMERQEFLVLAEKIALGSASDEEVRLYAAYYNSFAEEPIADQARLGAEISRRLEYVVRPKRVGWYRYAAAAAILLFLGSGAFFYRHSRQPVRLTANDIRPGTDKAMLTLANGQKIALTGARNGMLATQGRTVITKTADGQLAYDGSGAAGYNTLATPRGGQYRLTLSDGTRVWLNAASSLTYPAAFSGRDRTVEVTGEAYFEVAHDAKRPFHVKALGQLITDIGTAFNVNAYADESATRTTLVAGSVSVNQQVLVPGQQAIGEGRPRILPADLEQVAAWKNGLTSFENADIRTLMRQVARWYDLDIVYAGNLPGKHFTGAVSRSANLSELLKILQLSNIHFEVSGHTLTVKP